MFKVKRKRENYHLKSYIEYSLNGLIHREDGPAKEYSDGQKEWFLNGKPHREDGPAVINANGGSIWYKHGKRFYKREAKIIQLIFGND